jgi:DNA-binding transcriptional ArsR family regulator
MANNVPFPPGDVALLDRSFAACSHPIRRGILERLAAGEMTVGQATGDFGVSKPAISKHLKVLEEAGAIIRIIDGRTHRLRLDERSLEDAYAWMTNQHELWERKLDTVERFLREQREARSATERSEREHKQENRSKRSDNDRD